MKKQAGTLIIGIIIGAMAFGSIAVATELIVMPSTQGVYVDGTQKTIDAYNINGSNYFKARDFAAAMDVGMWYNEETRGIMIETDKGYDASYTGGGVTAPSSNGKTAIGTVLMENNGVKITYKGIELLEFGDSAMLAILLQIENSSNSGIKVAATDASINNVMKTIAPGTGMEILEGKQSLEKFIPTNLWDTGINTVSDIDKVQSIEMKLVVYDGSYKELFTSETITITP